MTARCQRLTQGLEVPHWHVARARVWVGGPCGRACWCTRLGREGILHRGCKGGGGAWLTRGCTHTRHLNFSMGLMAEHAPAPGKAEHKAATRTFTVDATPLAAAFVAATMLAPPAGSPAATPMEPSPSDLSPVWVRVCTAGGARGVACSRHGRLRMQLAHQGRRGQHASALVWRSLVVRTARTPAHAHVLPACQAPAVCAVLCRLTRAAHPQQGCRQCCRHAPTRG